MTIRPILPVITTSRVSVVTWLINQNQESMRPSRGSQYCHKPGKGMGARVMTQYLQACITLSFQAYESGGKHSQGDGTIRHTIRAHSPIPTRYTTRQPTYSNRQTPPYPPVTTPINTNCFARRITCTHGVHPSWCTFKTNGGNETMHAGGGVNVPCSCEDAFAREGKTKQWAPQNKPRGKSF